MKTKLVYVVVSSEHDIYLEQAYISMYSAKYYMPDVHIALITDTLSKETFIGNRKEELRYVDELVCVDLDARYNAQQRSRILKTSVRKYIEGDFLFVDSDTIIVKPLNEIDDCPYNIAACWDSHSSFEENPYRKMCLEHGKLLGWPIENETEYFNSGIIYVKDNEFCHKFYDLWNNNWLEGFKNRVSMDQPAFAKTNYMTNHSIKRLDDIWNCELKHGIRFLKDAKIVHYLCTNIIKNDKAPFILNDRDTLLYVKETAQINEDIKNTIMDPFSGLANCTHLSAGKEIYIFRTRLYSILKELYFNKHKQFIFIENKIVQTVGLLKRIKGGVNLYDYTIIIPHRNIPRLLQRCLDSIPRRTDLQVIVVDDCSDEEVIGCLRNMSLEYPHVTFIYSETSGGGGRARNEGLKLAKGNYILFADADDFFNHCMDDVLEEYKSTNYDLVYFNANSLDTDTYVTTFRGGHLNKMISLYEKNQGKAILQLKYLFGEPWCKMVKREIIERNGISFSETNIHNDTKYSYLVGHYSSDIHVDKRAIYCVTDRTDSVSKCISLDRLFTRTFIFAEATMFYRNNEISLYGLFVFNPLHHFMCTGDWENCNKCYRIMKTCGMSDPLILKGYSTFLLRRMLRIPLRLLRKASKIIK